MPVSAAIRINLQSAMRILRKIASGVRCLNCEGPRTASHWSTELPRGTFWVVLRAVTESANEN
eukprot:11305258-Alexandrium_andersonii.AAC.1